jgi:hypothetical protein
MATAILTWQSPPLPDGSYWEWGTAHFDLGLLMTQEDRVPSSP